MEKVLLRNENIFVINNFLTADECSRLIAKSELAGFDEAPVTTESGPVMLKDVRNNTRAMMDDIPLAEELFERARPLLPARMFGKWQIVGMNERLRYYRYNPGEKFSPHYDGAFERNNQERSQLTFMLYLNEEFEGGETKFHESPKFAVKPKTGQALVFIHHQLHEGAPVLTGRKYVLRTDVMYATGKTLLNKAAALFS